jgi:hypothetical protein
MVVLWLPAVARAELPSAIAIGGDDNCPRQADVMTVLRELLPTVPVSNVPSPGALLVTLVGGGGDHYGVRFPGGERELSGDAGACLDRARKIGVFIALALDPPMVVGRNRPPKWVPPVYEPATLPMTVREGRLEVELEAAVLGVVSADARGLPFAAGGVARVAVSRGWLGGSLGIAASGSSGILTDAGTAGVVRVPIDVAMRARFREGRVQLDGELGVVVGVNIVNGLGPDQQILPDVGIRVAAGMGLRLKDRVAPFVGVDAAIVPVPPDLRTTAATVGHLPQFWVGLRAGCQLRVL